MKLNKEEIIVFFRQNIVTIFLSIVSSILLGLFVFYIFNINKEETKDYSEIDKYKTESVIKNEEQKEEAASVYIDIKGAVNNPGVYELTNDKRIKDAIEKAGGLKDDANTENINLSQKLKDQMLIVIPKIGEKINNDISTQKTVNINLATKEELMKITGLGETKVQAIIDYRENKGDFKKKEDITKVKGIGKATLEKIKDKIDV